jgi:hypothetical protein
MAKDHHFKINDDRWLWRYTALRGEASGWTEFIKKKVLIDQTLRNRVRLETEIHEAIHATLGPVISEEAVTQSAQDISKILWSLGYRISPEAGRCRTRKD